MRSRVCRVFAVCACTMLAAGTFWASTARAQTAAPVPEYTVAGLTLDVVFLRATPCTPYTVRWGDGERTIAEGADGEADCGRSTVFEFVTHTYTQPGVYEVSIEHAETETTEEVFVLGPLETISLDDITDISAELEKSTHIGQPDTYEYSVTLSSGERYTMVVPVAQADAAIAAIFGPDSTVSALDAEVVLDQAREEGVSIDESSTREDRADRRVSSETEPEPVFNAGVTVVQIQQQLIIVLQQLIVTLEMLVDRQR